jgi:hypothetical protein
LAYPQPKRYRRASRWTRAIAREVLRPRSWRKWVEAALDTLGLIPALRVPVEAVNLSLLLLQGDYLEFALALAGFACLPGLFGLIVKITRLARKLWQAVCCGVSIARRAEAMA